MFYAKNHKQAYICDPWGHLGPKRRKVLDKSWSGLFQQKILPTLPVEALHKHYHDWNGRPTKELYSMIGLMILQQLAEDVFFLTQHFSSVSTVHEMHSFKLLTRLFKEQCIVEKEDMPSEAKAVARPNKEMPSNSLQNESITY